MKRHQIASLIILSTILSFILLATACGAEPTAPTPSVTPTLSVTDTDEAVIESPQTALQGEVVGALATLVADRPPVPSPTPGPVDRAVKQVATRSGLEGRTLIGLSTEDWINVGVSVVFVLISSLLVIVLLFGFLRWAVRRTTTQLDDALMATIERELSWLVVILLTHEAAIRLEFWSPAQRNTLDDIFFLLALAVITIIGFRLIAFAADTYEERLKTRADRHRWASFLEMLKRLGYLLVSVIALNVGLGHFGVDITLPTVLFLFFIAVIVIGARAAIEDAVSGFLILVDRPFQVGDDILIKELDTWGKVLEIGIRSTRMYIYDNREIIVPNSLISANQVINYSNPDPSFRVQIEFGVASDTDIQQLRQVITKAVREVEGVMPDQPVDVLFITFGDSSLKIRVRWWIESYNGQLVITDLVNAALQRALHDAAIEIPHPIYDINMISDSHIAD